MWESIKTAFRIPEIRKKIWWTVFLLAVFRLGSYIVVPGMSSFDLGEHGLFSLLDMFSGGALSNMSLFALGVQPYITSSIIINLLTVVIPGWQELSKEGPEGRRVLARYTKYGTVILGLIQAFAITMNFRGAMDDPNSVGSLLSIVLIMTAGTVFLTWLGEHISERGIGNGVSMLIFAGIVARFVPDAVLTLQTVGEGGPSLIGLILFLILSVLIVAFVVIVTQGERKIPVQYAKRVVGRKMYGGQATHMPLRVNQVGVIPVIFASSVLAFPVTIATFFPPESGFIKFVQKFLFPGQPIYLVLYAIFIFLFSYFYTAVTFNPMEVADNLKKYGGFIPGIRPGRPTAEYLDKILTRITTAGALFLTFVALLPYLLGPLTGIRQIGFGGTSLLIAVGVAIDTMKQIEAQLVMRQYEGFLK
ncbi:MAG TPA: preprotein translocase subunit SecY [Firmicutes bacterium]|uniref:Protein translocase subunit SecY n=1 Tax=Capillibacterium thermochitinicola TaxID=2699427 RepID=A0A8J6HWJ1_9FIRM|nr:preprotein translocase subunit SecY [Capillibacterium thermochitinicola]MBA2132552.1 preprotein translocase subunit SecY [Capillibacterium thermochitinicola]HHW11553.1 preprotein translocase subunit SecY [Bacillota bacterium]